MKKLISFVAAIMMVTTAFGQTAIDLAKKQAELNQINMKMLKQKPSKQAKKQAKELVKEGWKVPAGAKSIEQMITESQLYGEELMTDETGSICKRYIMQTAIQTSGSYNAGYAAARNSAQTELAAMIKTQLAAAMQQSLDNSQTAAISTVTVDKFNERSKAIVDQVLTNTMSVLAIYRRANNNYEVQVRLAFDKKEIAARIKRNMAKQLEEEGDELEKIVDEIIYKRL